MLAPRSLIDRAGATSSDAFVTTRSRRRKPKRPRVPTIMAAATARSISGLISLVDRGIDRRSVNTVGWRQRMRDLGGTE